MIGASLCGAFVGLVAGAWMVLLMQDRRRCRGEIRIPPLASHEHMD